MSRDASRDAGDAQGDVPGEPVAELLTAYVDGVAELSADERRRLSIHLARDPQAREDEARVRTLLAQLRALPPEGAGSRTEPAEPDWAAMARSIRDAVGRDVPRPWWRRWRWLASAATMATAMVALLVMWTRPELIAPPTSAPVVEPGRAPRAQPGRELVPLWLDGAEVDVDLSASDILGDAMPGEDEPAPTEHDDADLGLLPASDLAWIDRLDDAALARAERWLSDARPAPAVPDGAGQGQGRKS